MNKWLAAALAACLCAGAWCPSALAEAGGEAEPPVPKIVVSGTRVSGGKTFELGLRVKQEGLKSVSATLSFDADKLIPASWDAEATPVDLTGAKGWDTAKELPTKLAADGMFYKPARAWLDAEGKTGYLYLGAAYDTPADVDGLTTLVRFAYAGGVKPEELKLDGGADSVVRFAPDEAALANTLFPQKLGYTVRGAAEGQLTQYLYEPIKEGADGAPEADADYAFCILEADKEFSLTDGGSNAGGGSADGFCTVVFYDWDGTLLGSRVVAKGGSLRGDHNSKDERDNAAPNAAPLPPEGNAILDSEGNDTGVVNKAGYSFAGWVDYETGHTTPSAALANAAGLTIDDEELIELTNIQENKVVKAAYDESSIGATTSAKRYDVSYSPFETGGGGLQTTFTVSRKATARRGNEGVMYLQLTLRPLDRGATVISVPLGKGEVETFMLTMPSSAVSTYQATNAISYVVYTELDTGKTDNRSLSANIKATDIINHAS